MNLKLSFIKFILIMINSVLGIMYHNMLELKTHYHDKLPVKRLDPNVTFRFKNINVDGVTYIDGEILRGR